MLGAYWWRDLSGRRGNWRGENVVKRWQVASLSAIPTRKWLARSNAQVAMREDRFGAAVVAEKGRHGCVYDGLLSVTGIAVKPFAYCES